MLSQRLYWYCLNVPPMVLDLRFFFGDFAFHSLELSLNIRTSCIHIWKADQAPVTSGSPATLWTMISSSPKDCHGKNWITSLVHYFCSLEARTANSLYRWFSAKSQRKGLGIKFSSFFPLLPLPPWKSHPSFLFFSCACTFRRMYRVAVVLISWYTFYFRQLHRVHTACLPKLYKF